MFTVGDYAIINEKASKGLPDNVGDLVELSALKPNSFNYEFEVRMSNGDISFVREVELNKLTQEQEELIKYIRVGNIVLYAPADEKVKILKADYLHKRVEIEFLSGGTAVVLFRHIRTIEDGETKVGLTIDLKTDNKQNYFRELGESIGNLVDEKQKAYGDSVTKSYKIMKVLLEDYWNEETHTYNIPESLLKILLLEVRKLDKTNRRFSNPDGDLMGENPYQDDVGYSMLGVRMMEQNNLK